MANAQPNPAAYTVQAWASVQENPPVITLHWKHDPHAQQYEIFKRNLGTSMIGRISAPSPERIRRLQIVPSKRGLLYEYEILNSSKSDSVYAAFGFVASGIDVHSPVSPGTVILLVDNTYSTPLASEISRWISRP